MRVDEAGRQRAAATVDRGDVGVVEGIGSIEIFSIMLPRTRAPFEGAESAALLPSKMRTFWNRTVDCGADGPGSASAPLGRWEAASSAVSRRDSYARPHGNLSMTSPRSPASFRCSSRGPWHRRLRTQPSRVPAPVFIDLREVDDERRGG